MSLSSRPPTPDSPSSLRNATATIDDLTIALLDFSRGYSPEPLDVTTCCCGREDCETTKAWSAARAKLQSRLVMAAEVGQALLERHEAYVRRHELGRQSSELSSSVEQIDLRRTEEQVDARVADLVKENAVLEKRLSQALVQSEIADVSHQNALQELTQAQATIGRLTAQHARSVGLETRLSNVMQERDDIQQERDSATQRARMAEARITSLKERCAKFQTQVNRLREDLETQRSHRQELSAEILSDARQRLQQLQQVRLGHTTMVDDAEITKVLESLVADNENLKQDNAELQNILSETREDLWALQLEVDERRADDTQSFQYRHASAYDTPAPLSPTFHVGTAPTPSVLHSLYRGSKAGPSADRRAVSMERPSRRVFEPLTPETDRRPLSPTDSLMPSDTKWTSFSSHPQSYAPSQLSFDIDNNGPMSSERSRAAKSLLLLTRSRGVQTDGTGQAASLLAPSPIPRAFGDQMSSSSPRDGQSESSSLVTSDQSSVIGILVDRIAMLMSRLSQADALTLTNRLKRQRLLGADVSHLSRSTVSGIIQEVTTLRSHFRAFLEDDKVTTTCTRKDLRGLFKLFKDMFSEMGQLRVTLNDVILDPTVAGRVSDMAMHPSKSNLSSLGSTSDPSTNSAGTGWMAPISKLLGLPSSNTNPEQAAANRALSPPAQPSSRGRSRPPPRIVPKREPALSATAMTINVEFSGTTVGRAVTNTYSAHPDRANSAGLLGMQTPASVSPMSAPGLRSSSSVMNIFAGAPRMMEPTDPWIVVPKPLRGSKPPLDLGRVSGNTTIGRSATLRVGSGSGGGSSNKRLSRIVDAITDPSNSSQDDDDDEAGEGRDVVQDTLLERTLRPRGLSDSSIHTTFMSHGEEKRPSTSADNAEQVPQRQDRQSVLQALSRKVQSFRFASASFASAIPSATASAAAASAISRPQTPVAGHTSGAPLTVETSSVPVSVPRRTASPTSTAAATGLFPSLWTTLDAANDPTISGVPSYPFAESPRGEAYLGRNWAREREM